MYKTSIKGSQCEKEHLEKAIKLIEKNEIRRVKSANN